MFYEKEIYLFSQKSNKLHILKSLSYILNKEICLDLLFK